MPVDAGGITAERFSRWRVTLKRKRATPILVMASCPDGEILIFVAEAAGEEGVPKHVVLGLLRKALADVEAMQ
jgi:hypothetical protein